MNMGTPKLAAAAALAAGVLMSSAASAAPAASTQALAQQADSNVQAVRDRGGRHGGWRGHRRHGGWNNGWGWGAAAAATGLLLGAPYAFGDDGYDGYDGGYAGYGGDGYAYRGRYAGGGGEARCEATFRSYDPSSGTYMGYDGVRRECPYL
jgi:hypothetical protein